MNNTLNEFGAKAFANELKTKFGGISGIRVIPEKSRFVFVLEFKNKRDLSHSYIHPPKEEFDKEEMFNDVRSLIFNLQFNMFAGFSESQTLSQYKARYFFYTGRHIEQLSIPVQKTIKELKSKGCLNFRLNKVIKILSERSEEEFNSAEWQYFKDSNFKRNHVIETCGRCEVNKVLRDEEEECCDICWDCYNEIADANNNVLKRTHDAIGYLRGTQNNDPKLEMSAFLSIFHPELSKSKREMLIREAK